MGAKFGHFVSEETKRKAVATRMKNGSYVAWNKGRTDLPPSWNKGKRLSKKHRENISKNHHSIKGSKNPRWKGGKLKHSSGYIMILKPNHPRPDKRGYVFEHRLVMEKNLGRYLNSKEIVHHINGIRNDNRIENLKLFRNHSDHVKFHFSSIKN